MNQNRKARIIFAGAFCTISAFWLFIALNVIKISLPYNSFGTMLYGKSEIIFKSVLPEGFAFFTRDPREFQITIYNSNKEEIDLHNGSWSYLLGVNRYPRAYNVELGHIFSVIAAKQWYNCQSGGIDCLDDSVIPLYVIQNNFPHPMLKGEYYLKIDEPTPWAWAKSYKDLSKKMPCKVMKLSIQ